jgi:hypothetical protein
MACLWANFGVIVGLATAPPHSDAIGALAGVVAGLIVLVPLGAFLGALGGHLSLAAWGGVCGTGMGVGTAALAGSAAMRVAPVTLIAGAAAGATLPLALARVRNLFHLFAGVPRSP